MMSVPPVHPTRLSPYRGLEPFDESDAAFFFGRERETRLITASLFAAPLTIIYGASGAGKSSVLRAGVIPRLRGRRDLLPIVFPTLTRDRDKGSIVLRGWQADPLTGVKETAALALFDAADPEGLARYRETVLDHNKAPLREYLSALHTVSGRRLMVILDQFEEYSLYHPEDDAFGEQFPQAIVPGDLSVSFLVCLREDALARLDRFKGRIPNLWDSYRRIDHLETAAAEDAIRLPLGEYNLHSHSAAIGIEDRLVEAVLRDVRTGGVQFEETGSGAIAPGAHPAGRIETPYLQLVMMRLWDRERSEGSTKLRWSTLAAEGGAAEIVRTHLDRVMAQFTPQERDLAAKVFHRLVTPSGAKIAFSVSDLALYEAIEPERLVPILRRLEEGSQRILRRVAGRSEATEEPVYEIFHDRLGPAILSWRARRLQEQERERRQREEAERRRIADQSRAGNRARLESAMQDLGHDLQDVWVRIMFYLVSTDGRRFARTVSELSSLSRQSQEQVQSVVKSLLRSEILDAAYVSRVDADRSSYQVRQSFVPALLEWHSSYVGRPSLRFAGNAIGVSGRIAKPPGQESQSGGEFPYRVVSELLRSRQILVLLGSGVPQSARREPTVGASRVFPPSNRELKEQLARLCDFPPEELETSDIAEVASLYIHRLGRPSLDELLQKSFAVKHYKPSSSHGLLARAAAASSTPLLILTTNFDSLMEAALGELGAAFEVWTYVTVPGPAMEGPVRCGISSARDWNPAARICRLTGPAMRPAPTGEYVLAEEDQIDWVAGLDVGVVPQIQPLLADAHFLMLGTSADSWAQRALLRRFFARRSRSKTSWAVNLNPSARSVIAWQRYGIEVHNIELNDWCSRMEQNGTAAH